MRLILSPRWGSDLLADSPTYPVAIFHNCAPGNLSDSELAMLRRELALTIRCLAWMLAHNCRFSPLSPVRIIGSTSVVPPLWHVDKSRLFFCDDFSFPVIVGRVLRCESKPNLPETSLGSTHSWHMDSSRTCYRSPVATPVRGCAFRSGAPPVAARPGQAQVRRPQTGAARGRESQRKSRHSRT